MTSMVDETIADRQTDHGSNNQGGFFIDAVLANLDAAKGCILRGSVWNSSECGFDIAGSDNGPIRSCSLSGSENTFGGELKRVGIATAAVAAWGRPLSPDDIVMIVNRIVSDDRKLPRLIGLCSTDGFAGDALDRHYESCGFGKDTSVVLVAPTQHGWAVHGVKNADDDRVRSLFDPEGDTGRKQRLLDGLRDRRVELREGILIDDLARDLGLERQFVADALAQEAKSDQSIRLFEINGCIFVFRTSGQRTRSMGILSIFRGKEKAKQQNREDLELERAALQKRRDMVYADIEKLEKKEAGKVAEGKEAAKAKSSAVRRVAAEVAELRKEIERHHQTAALLGQKVNIASTHIHNIALQGLQGTGATVLPDEEQLTDAAVATEEMIEETKRVSELADSLRSDHAGLAASTEEDAIMEEFNDADGQETDAESATEDDAGFEPETIILPEQPVRQAVDERPAEGERSAEAG